MAAAETIVANDALNELEQEAGRARDRTTAAREGVKRAKVDFGLAANSLMNTEAVLAHQRRSVDLHEELVRHRSHLPTLEEVAQVGIHTRLLEKRLDLADELLRGLKTWRWLAYLVPVLLAVTLFYSFRLLDKLRFRVDDLKGVELTSVIIALAIFVISPSVLLLLERPLKRLDEDPGEGSSSAPEEPEPEENPSATPASDGTSDTPSATKPSKATGVEPEPEPTRKPKGLLRRRR